METSRVDSDARVPSPSGFTGGQSAASQDNLSSELDTTEVLAMLRSAVQLDDADPQGKMQALASARASSASTYEALLQKNDADLTADMREAIRLYQDVGNQMAQLQTSFVDEALGNYTSLYDEIMKIPAVNRTEQMMQFLEIFLRIAQQSRQTATTLSVLGFQTQIKELQSQAQKIRDEGAKTFDAGMARGATMMASGAAGGFAGGGAFYKQVRGTKHIQRAERLGVDYRNKEQEITKIKDDIYRLDKKSGVADDPSLLQARSAKEAELEQEFGCLNEIDRSKRAADRASKQYADSANNWTNSGITFGTFGRSAEAFAGSSLDQQANRDRSEQTERQAAATAGEQNKTLAEKFADSSQAVVASVLQTVRDVGLAEAEAYKAAARA